MIGTGPLRSSCSALPRPQPQQQQWRLGARTVTPGPLRTAPSGSGRAVSWGQGRTRTLPLAEALGCTDRLASPANRAAWLVIHLTHMWQHAAASLRLELSVVDSAAGNQLHGECSLASAESVSHDRQTLPRPGKVFGM